MTTTPATARSVELERRGSETYVARNVRGGELLIGGSDEAFTPVELLLAALASCSAVDVDVATARRVEPTSFRVRVDAEKVKDDAGGNVLRDLVVTFEVAFPDGPAGDAARQVLPRAARVAHDRTCTVSRTLEAGAPVTIRIAEPERG